MKRSPRPIAAQEVAVKPSEDAWLSFAVPPAWIIHLRNTPEKACDDDDHIYADSDSDDDDIDNDDNSYIIDDSDNDRNADNDVADGDDNGDADDDADDGDNGDADDGDNDANENDADDYAPDGEEEEGSPLLAAQALGEEDLVEKIFSDFLFLENFPFILSLSR